jgi:hypothetical protein
MDPERKPPGASPTTEDPPKVRFDTLLRYCVESCGGERFSPFEEADSREGPWQRERTRVRVVKPASVQIEPDEPSPSMLSDPMWLVAGGESPPGDKRSSFKARMEALLRRPSHSRSNSSRSTPREPPPLDRIWGVTTMEIQVVDTQTVAGAKPDDGAGEDPEEPRQRPVEPDLPSDYRVVRYETERLPFVTGPMSDTDHPDGGCFGSAGGLCAAAHRVDGGGPMAEPRRCRDVLCALMFVLTWVCWLILVWAVVAPRTAVPAARGAHISLELTAARWGRLLMAARKTATIRGG